MKTHKKWYDLIGVLTCYLRKIVSKLDFSINKLSFDFSNWFVFDPAEVLKPWTQNANPVFTTHLLWYTIIFLRNAKTTTKVRDKWHSLHNDHPQNRADNIVIPISHSFSRTLPRFHSRIIDRYPNKFFSIVNIFSTNKKKILIKNTKISQSLKEFIILRLWALKI